MDRVRDNTTLLVQMLLSLSTVIDISRIEVIDWVFEYIVNQTRYSLQALFPVLLQYLEILFENTALRAVAPLLLHSIKGRVMPEEGELSTIWLKHPLQRAKDTMPQYMGNASPGPPKLIAKVRTLWRQLLSDRLFRRHHTGSSKQMDITALEGWLSLYERFGGILRDVPADIVPVIRQKCVDRGMSCEVAESHMGRCIVVIKGKAQGTS